MRKRPHVPDNSPRDRPRSSYLSPIEAANPRRSAVAPANMSSPPDESMDESAIHHSSASDNESETGPLQRFFPSFHNLPVRTFISDLLSM